MHRLQLEHGTIAYDEQGSGPLVVLIPGLGDLRQEYRFLAPRLEGAGYRVVTVDLRGHGDSSADWPTYTTGAAAADLLALLDRLQGGPAVVVGNSFGAGPAVWAAADHPEAIRGLVLIGPFVRDHDTGPMQKIAMAVLFSGPWRVRAWAWYYGTLFPTHKPADFAPYLATLRANLAQPGRFEAVKAMMARSDAEVEARLSRVKAPSRVVMGSKDPDFPDPVAEARFIADRLGGEYRMIEGAGHYPQTEMPDETAAELLRFLDGIRGAA